MAFAIVRTCGKQHRVEQGMRLWVDRIAQEVGSEFTLDEVLLLGQGEQAKVGTPLVPNAKVLAKVLAHARGDKIRVFKRRKRKGFHKTIGHRQALTEIEITQVG